MKIPRQTVKNPIHPINRGTSILKYMLYKFQSATHKNKPEYI